MHPGGNDENGQDKDEIITEITRASHCDQYNKKMEWKPVQRMGWGPKSKKKKNALKGNWQKQRKNE